MTDFILSEWKKYEINSVERHVSVTNDHGKDDISLIDSQTNQENVLLDDVLKKLSGYDLPKEKALSLVSTENDMYGVSGENIANVLKDNQPLTMKYFFCCCRILRVSIDIIKNGCVYRPWAKGERVCFLTVLTLDNDSETEVYQLNMYNKDINSQSSGLIARNPENPLKSFNSYTKDDLIEISKMINISQSGKKKELYDKINNFIGSLW